MKRLNIFVDETGEFGFEKGASELYGISFTFHEQKNTITHELNELNNRLNKLGYTDMIHMAHLVMKRDDYKNFSPGTRKSIFNAIYQFSKKIPAKYYTIIINKKYANNKKILRKQIFSEINKMVENHEEYFNKFNKIIMYYDNGQETLGIILDSIFSKLNGFEHRIDFDHKEKRLFQVSDMLTFIDKYDYKYRHKLSFSKSEIYFLGFKEIRKILKELSKKRF